MSTTQEPRHNEQSVVRRQSSNTVTVFWLNRDEVLTRLKRASQSLLAEHSEIAEVRLFGSVARGDAVPGSDANVLLVLDRCELPFRARSPHYAMESIGVSVDIRAYTEAEIIEMKDQNGSILKTAMSEGLVLSERHHSNTTPSASSGRSASIS